MFAVSQEQQRMGLESWALIQLKLNVVHRITPTTMRWIRKLVVNSPEVNGVRSIPGTTTIWIRKLVVHSHESKRCIQYPSSNDALD
ncbi:jg27474 [Pararge aegeria aegeria]|uniref:Jg27474 protein n=1 Tax=Pararge aegeria aegeria TaxID=348720 RepID=A0A8S4QN65_9NEOP|nr:jg27474 [Pararge aegeria aegeria]